MLSISFLSALVVPQNMFDNSDFVHVQKRLVTKSFLKLHQLIFRKNASTDYNINTIEYQLSLPIYENSIQSILVTNNTWSTSYFCNG